MGERREIACSVYTLYSNDKNNEIDKSSHASWLRLSYTMPCGCFCRLLCITTNPKRSTWGASLRTQNPDDYWRLSNTSRCKILNRYSTSLNVYDACKKNKRPTKQTTPVGTEQFQSQGNSCLPKQSEKPNCPVACTCIKYMFNVCSALKQVLGSVYATGYSMWN